ncbi:hypothetical protein HGO97_000275 [Faecalicatena sp. AGMB00832]|uniref:CheW-like domain-containing protein n=1 Tax=Faecalicatena faecalis TaxID=2726362 RepID=A0ABS6CY70_9FIRM|nr:hypothetical protein [Faecalicatena faecalis]MBU3874254.1 hypothetical protein [Faecalicatena faecalis]
MDSLDRSYLAFRSDRILYLLPLNEVERIVDGRLETEGIFVDFSELTGREKRDRKMRYQYGVLFHSGSDDVKAAECPGILVEEIEGILENGKLEEFTLKSPVRNCQNNFIKAAARIRTEEFESVGYILDIRQLSNRFLEQREKEEKSSQDEERSIKEAEIGTEPNGTVDQERTGHSHKIRIHNEANGPCSMDLPEESVYDSKGTLLQTIILEREDQVLYAEKTMVTAVVMRPEIWKVPGESSRGLGISFYEGDLVIYYDQFEEEKGIEQSQERMEFACGIIFRTEEGNLAGLAGDSTGEKEFSQEDMDDIVSVGSGIWVRRSD